MIEEGHPSRLWSIVQALESSVPEVVQSLNRLEVNHGFVPHPGSVDAWVIHPFSSTPTSTYVAGSERGWWAPCMWCGLGIAALVGSPVTISARVGGEEESVEVTVSDGKVDDEGLLVHFPIPVAQAWESVHAFCASVQVFRDEVSIDAWCERHGKERGAAIPIQQVADLASEWYGGHADPEWRKPTTVEAQAMFERAGLTGDHWALPDGDGRF